MRAVQPRNSTGAAPAIAFGSAAKLQNALRPHALATPPCAHLAELNLPKATQITIVVRHWNQVTNRGAGMDAPDDTSALLTNTIAMDTTKYSATTPAIRALDDRGGGGGCGKRGVVTGVVIGDASTAGDDLGGVFASRVRFSLSDSTVGSWQPPLKCRPVTRGCTSGRSGIGGVWGMSVAVGQARWQWPVNTREAV